MLFKFRQLVVNIVSKELLIGPGATCIWSWISSLINVIIKIVFLRPGDVRAYIV